MKIWRPDVSSSHDTQRREREAARQRFLPRESAGRERANEQIDRHCRAQDHHGCRHTVPFEPAERQRRASTRNSGTPGMDGCCRILSPDFVRDGSRSHTYAAVLSKPR